jgi:plastocyanin
MCNSPSQPVFDTKGAFGPFAGQMFVGDVAGPCVLRVMLEEVDGVMQGACVKFVEGLRAGNNRLVFSPDGTQLYVGQTVRGWGNPSEGLQRVTFTGALPFDVKAMTLTKEGFTLTFTKPVEAIGGARPGSYKAKHYRYRYSPAYGSPQIDEADLAVGAATLSADGLTVTLAIAGLQVDRIVQLDLDLNAADGSRIRQPRLCYTINRLRK